MKIGKYIVTGELGRGGMAVVHSALDPVIDRPVAVKAIRKGELDPADAPATLERFKREARAAGGLQHPNIVAIYEYGEDADLAWIAMELVNGRTLRDHLRDGWRPEPDRMPGVLEQLLEALDYSHGRGVVHRDIKPANMLISASGDLKISDFGIARIERSHLTQAGDVLGTPYYMAPEQFDGHEADERTDIYAAAVVVYEVLCGRRPFDAQGGALMRQILDGMPPAPTSLEPRVPKAVENVLLKALSKAPDDRYASTHDFLIALRTAFAAKSAQVPVATPASASATAAVAPAAPAPRLAANLGALRRGIGAGTAAAPSGTQPATAPSGPRKPAVLFVDDEERVLNALRLQFRGIYDVDVANSGKEALERLRARRYLVLVSDQRMPEMTGVELLREAKTLAPTTVRILLTGYSDLAAIVGSVNESEVFRFVSKPWEQEEIQETLAEAAEIAIALEAARLRGGQAIRSDAAVLVWGDPAAARAARELARGGLRVLETANLDDTLALLSAEDVGVLVCDLDAHAEDAQALLRVLKQTSPATQLIVIAEASDSETIIGLINEARIHRFLKKPLNLALLQPALASALERHARVRASEAELGIESARRGRETSAVTGVLGRLKALGGRFASALRAR